jgi:hypothetical protein
LRTRSKPPQLSGGAFSNTGLRKTTPPKQQRSLRRQLAQRRSHPERGSVHDPDLFSRIGRTVCVFNTPRCEVILCCSVCLRETNTRFVVGLWPDLGLQVEG